ncbi:hypothetical protein [Clostridium sp. LP20]|uniref:hypothetical protein n=1 Tax=Clostridium sp. LP20 TaxID=3418665 RepID=UPI003EE77BB3
MSINTVDLLGITYDEKIISNLIVRLINNSLNFRNSFLHHIVEIKDTSQYRVEARTKIGTSRGVPDIIIIAEGKENVIVTVIESKLKASTGHNQIIVYSEDACINEILAEEKIDLDGRRLERKFVYLSLTEDGSHSSEDYIIKTYNDLVENVWVEVEDAGLNKIYKDFCAKMINYYSSGNISEKDKFLNVLLKHEEKEKVFIKFRELILSIDYPNNLKLEFFGKTGGSDELGFITKITKGEWMGKEARWENDIYGINKDTYDIHMEGSFNIIRERLKLTIHYEPNPYISRTSLEKWSLPEAYAAFEDRRNRVKEQVYKNIAMLEDDHIKEYDGVNGIAFVEINFDENTTIEEFKDKFVYYVSKLSVILDKALIRS